MCLVAVDIHLDLTDAALADEAGPYEVGEEGLIFRDSVALDECQWYIKAKIHRNIPFG